MDRGDVLVRVVGKGRKERVSPLPEGWEAFRQNKYGETLLTFFRRKP